MNNISIITEHCNDLKILFNVFKNLSPDDEINLDFISDIVDNKIKIACINKNMTIVAYAILHGHNFIECNAKYNTTIGIDLRKLCNWFALTRNDDKIKIFVNDDSNIFFERINEIRPSLPNHIQKSLLVSHVNWNHLKKCNEFDYTVMLDTKILNDTLKSMMHVNEYIKITCDKNRIIFECNHDDKDIIKSFDNTEIEIHSQNESENITCKNIYNLEDINQIIFGSKLSQDTTLHIKNNFPLFVRYNIGCLGEMLIGVSDCKLPINDY